MGCTQTLKSCTYVGNYFLNAINNEDFWDKYNKLYLVYRVEIENSYTNEEESYNKVNEIYCYISFHDIVISPDGITTVDLTDYDTTYNDVSIDSGISSGWFGTMTWYYKGYETVDDLYIDTIHGNAEVYTCEMNIDAIQSERDSGNGV